MCNKLRTLQQKVDIAGTGTFQRFIKGYPFGILTMKTLSYTVNFPDGDKFQNF